MNYKKFMSYNPTKIGEITNQLGQLVEFYEDSDYGDYYPVIAVINEVVKETDFFDTADFYEDSDYNPVLVDGKIICAYELI